MVTRFPQEYDATGNVTAHGNLLTEYSSTEMNRFQREAHKRYSNAIAEGDVLPPTPFKATQLDPANNPDHKELFYSRVDSQVVAELIKNILTDSEYAKLMLKRSIFTFEDDTTGINLIDGPCLLKWLMDRVDPNIFIGIEVLRAKLELVKLHSFGNNVDAMLTDMEENYVKILDKHSTCESIRRYCLNALLSGPNAKFNEFIERIKDDIYSQTGLNKNMTFDEICTAARSKYNNMDA